MNYKRMPCNLTRCKLKLILEGTTGSTDARLGQNPRRAFSLYGPDFFIFLTEKGL